MEWTVASYAKIVSAAEGYWVCTVGEFLTDTQEGVLILRHDIDRRPEHSVTFAKAEYDLDIHSTYYARHKWLADYLDQLKQIQTWGHEIGYHYETTCTATFLNELSDFRAAGFDIQTIAAHGNPLSPDNNSTILDQLDLDKLGLKDAQQSMMDIGNMIYVTDASGDWSGKTSVYDRPMGKAAFGVKSYGALLDMIRRKAYGVVYLTTHPERWSDKCGVWAFERGRDLLAQTVKRGRKFLK